MVSSPSKMVSSPFLLHYAPPKKRGGGPYLWVPRHAQLASRRVTARVLPRDTWQASLCSKVCAQDAARCHVTRDNPGALGSFAPSPRFSCLVTNGSRTSASTYFLHRLARRLCIVRHIPTDFRALPHFTQAEIPSIVGVVLLDTDGKRIVAKYYKSNFASATEELAFEKKLADKTMRTNAKTEGALAGPALAAAAVPCSTFPRRRLSPSRALPPPYTSNRTASRPQRRSSSSMASSPSIATVAMSGCT